YTIGSRQSAIGEQLRRVWTDLASGSAQLFPVVSGGGSGCLLLPLRGSHSHAPEERGGVGDTHQRPLPSCTGCCAGGDRGPARLQGASKTRAQGHGGNLRAASTGPGTGGGGSA